MVATPSLSRGRRASIGTVVLGLPGGSALSVDPSDGSYQLDVDPASLTFDAAYGVSGAGSGDVSPFSWVDAILLPPDRELTAPFPGCAPGPLEIAWEGEASGGDVEVRLEVTGDDGRRQVTWCRAEDTGGFLVPEAAWADPPPGRISLSVTTRTERLLPRFDGGWRGVRDREAALPLRCASVERAGRRGYPPRGHEPEIG